MSNGNWWAELYDDALADIFLERKDPGEVERTVEFLEDKLRLSEGATIFDQCCGIGSLSIALAERGHRVVGVDQAARYIDRAAASAKRAGPDIDERSLFVTADAFTYRPPTACAAALNWWTSFGYAETDADNLQMLARSFEALEPGGRYALDFLNMPGILRRLQPQMVTRHPEGSGELLLIRDTTIDTAAGVMHKRWTTVLANGERRERHSRVRIYMPHEIAQFLTRCGFTNVELFGSVDGEPLGLDSPRCIAIGEKPTTASHR